jgi:hypothetical protein
MKYKQKLETFARRELLNLSDNLIVEDDGKYFIFGKYTVEKIDNKFKVGCRDDLVGYFSSSKTAVAWCIADKLGQINTAIRLRQLDQEFIRYDQDIHAKQRLIAKSKDFNFQETVAVKLERQITQRRAIETEILKCVNLAKYWQYRGFNNETERTSSNTTNQSSLKSI